MRKWAKKRSRSFGMLHIHVASYLKGSIGMYHVFPCFLNIRDKIGKAWLIWWCNRTQFRIFAISPTQWAWSLLRPHAELCEKVGRNMQPCLKPCPITSSHQPGIPFFSHVHWKTWEGLGTRLSSCVDYILIPQNSINRLLLQAWKLVLKN